MNIQTISDLSRFLQKSERTIRRRLQGKQSGAILFERWLAIDTNPEGERRMWVFQELQGQQPKAEAA
jgi:hypothetical protein